VIYNTKIKNIERECHHNFLKTEDYSTYAKDKMMNGNRNVALPNGHP
jgi:hypothetical protein